MSVNAWSNYSAMVCFGKMKVIILFTLFSVVLLGAYAEEEHEIKRGTFPFMAYIYYSDETVVDVTGNRFLRGAVLIRPNWLVTSAIQISSNDEEVRFPRKTLLARIGSMTIDTKFTVNEDEDEQEREIIQIVRPSNHSATQWWQADITLMKTLLPFTASPVVAPALLHPPYSTTNSCSILVYAKKHGNAQENRILMQIPVELLSPSIETCGNHFYESTMTCASDREDKNAVYDPNFCQGNNGGPLVCDGKILGLQTYIDNNCKPPHLYQLLTVWEKFLLCGTEDKCTEEECANRCVVTNKDTVTTTAVSWPADWPEATTNKTADTILEALEYSPTLTIKTTEEIVTPREETFTTKKVDITTEEDMNTTTNETTTVRITRTSEVMSTSENVSLVSEIVSTMSDETENKSWPKKTTDDEEDIYIPDRAGVESQREDGTYKKKLTVVRNAAGRNTRMIQSFCVTYILASLI